MSRPFPGHPRGARRKARVGRQLLGCQRVSPEWELGALRALIKPQLRGAIEHRSGLQAWPRGAERIVRAACDEIATRLDTQFVPHFPSAGTQYYVIEVEQEQLAEARALALLLSRRLSDLWLTMGKLFVLDGVFYRRQFGYRLKLVQASNIHLTRPIRQAMRDLLK